MQTTADALGKQLEQHTRASEALFGNIRALESKVSEALSKKETLKARAASAQVRFLLVSQWWLLPCLLTIGCMQTYIPAVTPCDA